MQRIYDGVRAGLKHLVLGVGLLTGLALYANCPDQLAALFGSEKSHAPRIIAMRGASDARCQAASVETSFGTLGCGGTRRAAHLEHITLTKGH
jgi:hypothetical protein